MNQCPPGPQVFHWGRFEFFQNSRRYSRINVYHRCQRHRRKAVVTDTGEKFIAGVVVTDFQ
jgi:hypothetical protein